jgi:phosphoserine aminotransferase
VPGDTVDYIVTGAWSKKACEEAAKFGLNVNVVAKGDNKSVPARDSWKLSPDAKYVHYCDNETIGGEWADTLDHCVLVCQRACKVCG